MSNIWEFLLQTASVSLVAALLLLVKRIFDDKLSPRWQYGIWIIFALRILLPVSLTKQILLPLPLTVETWKATAEQHLFSSYSGVLEPLSLTHVIPVLTVAPNSLTDWLFLLYAAGVIAFLLRYLFSYVRLRYLLSKGTPVSAAMQSRINTVCARYNLKSCSAITVEGISSAFICGIFRPILALPSDNDTEELILLHELLHLKHKDALQNIFWCFLRSLHWCNPFLYPVFRIIENDMEALCDQRVLEHLEGEDRRIYGKLLLSMANDTYARAPGTTSISNGGKNISKRITAIVRFKKYPKGMALVSVCAALLLASPCIIGTAATYHSSDFEPLTMEELTRSMAMSRLNRCTTMAGALDTYAKGLMLNNGVYIATASPLKQQAALTDAMAANNTDAPDWEPQFYYATDDTLLYADSSRNYQIFNIFESEKNCYEALLVLPVSRLPGKNGVGYLTDENGKPFYDCYVIVPVKLYKENTAWVVEESGERLCSTKKFFDTYYFPDDSDIPWMNTTAVTGTTGNVAVATRVLYQIDNTIPATTNGLSFWSSSSSFDATPKTDATFQFAKLASYILYDCKDNSTGQYPEKSAGIRIIELDTPEDNRTVEWPEEAQMTGSASGTSNQGYSWTNREFRDNWDYRIEDISTSYFYPEELYSAKLPYGYRIEIFWDGKPVEEFMITWEDTLWNNTKLYAGQ